MIMPASPTIRLLHRAELDTAKWDDCVRSSRFPLAYGHHRFLDQLCTHWDALVMGDYQAVLPLPWRRKWLVSYVYQPAFVQQLGPFSRNELTMRDLVCFLQVAQKLFRYGELNLGLGQPLPGALRRNNYVLPLGEHYGGISARYRADLRKNLKEAGRHQLVYTGQAGLEEIVRLYEQLYSHKMGFSRTDFTNLIQLGKRPSPGSDMVCRAVLRDGKMVSACACLEDGNRLYLLVSATNGEGRRFSANHFLLDRLVQEFAGSGLLLDFEGSDIEGIAHFYKNFGALPEPYQYVRWNRLPLPLRWLKPSSTG